MGMTFAKPHPASLGEIENVIRAFAHASEYLEKTGFDGVEIHAAHGYLVAQFLSATTNKRSDEYGVTLQGRSKLLLDIVSAIRQSVSSSFIVGVKLNSVEFQTGGIRTEEVIDLCLSLEAARVDFVELSGGTYEAMAFQHRNESTRRREAYFLEFAKTIVPALRKTKVYLTGGFRTAGAMVSALETLDGIGLGRPLCQDPGFCDEVLSRAVTGAAKLLIDENNTSLTNAAAVLQMRRLANGKQKLDLTKEGDVKVLREELSSWRKSSVQRRLDEGPDANL
jgi:2,4-dienoyl-CoA reductase-like NADH-dependent reductase (Old Yellow Enzyme family)